MSIQQLLLKSYGGAADPQNSNCGSVSGSVYYDANEYLKAAASDVYDFATDESFTMESWCYVTNGSRYNYIFLRWSSLNPGDYLWRFGINNSDKPFIAGSSLNLTANSAISLNEWFHLAIVRNTSTLTMYVNGNADGTASSQGTAMESSDEPVAIGANREATQYSMRGYLSNMRYTVGQALYTSDFIPPNCTLTTTSQGATASNVKLIGGTNTSTVTSFPTASTTISVGSGSPTASSKTPMGTGAVYFDDNEGLSVPANSSINIADNDFTMECWFKTASGATGFDTLFSLSNYGEGGGDSGPGNSFSFYLANDTGLRLFTRSGGSFTSRVDQSSTHSSQTWTHFMWSRSGTSNYVFINGSSFTGSTFTDQTNFTDGQDFYIGANDYNRSGSQSQYGMKGEISNVRLVIGQALFTSNFTRPTTPVTTTSQSATASNVQIITCNSPTSHLSYTKSPGELTATNTPYAVSTPISAIPYG